jgi:hypothetical protein
VHTLKASTRIRGWRTNLLAQWAAMLGGTVRGEDRFGFQLPQVLVDVRHNGHDLARALKGRGGLRHEFFLGLGWAQRNAPAVVTGATSIARKCRYLSTAKTGKQSGGRLGADAHKENHSSWRSRRRGCVQNIQSISGTACGIRWHCDL